MKLTSQEEYGLRCLLSLARLQSQVTPDAGAASVTIAQIAETEGLSAEYVGKLMGILTRAGLVESERGRNGGYRLARPAEGINLAEALAALGGPLYVSETCDRFTGDHSFCVHTSGCSIRSLWGGLQFLIDNILSRTLLADLLRLQEPNIAAWMQSHVEAVSTIKPLGRMSDSPLQSSRRGNVVVRGVKH